MHYIRYIILLITLAFFTKANAQNPTQADSIAKQKLKDHPKREFRGYG
ncbi:hypothetical protein [Mucilaginibacter humi]|nr:hypothetical protein [Mucilaginibacter humi]